ncbi:hypothetical protein L917_18857, partial [Phytophthora nicotianae]
MSRTRRLQGDWEAAHRLHRLALAVLSDASSRYSIPRVCFDIQEVTEDMCLFFYRFTHAQLRRLQKAFQLPDVIRTEGEGHSRAKCSGLEGLCITLHRLAYPSRRLSISAIYGRWPSALSSIFYHVVEHISSRSGRLLEGNLDSISSKCRSIAEQCTSMELSST